MATTLNSFHGGAVGLIDWVDHFGSLQKSSYTCEEPKDAIHDHASERLERNRGHETQTKHHNVRESRE